MKKGVLAGIFLVFLSLGISLLAFNIQPVNAYLDPDLNGDGLIDMRDVAIAARAFGSSTENDRWDIRADLDLDGEVNIEDVLLIAKYFGLVQAPTLGFVEPDNLTVILRPCESANETIQVIFSCIFDRDLGTLRLKTSEGFETWLTRVDPIEYADVWTNADPYVFEITLTVPQSTSPGTYSFQIIAYTLGDESPEIHQNVTIEVPPNPVIPEVPLGTIVASAAMIIALAAYAAAPKWRRTVISSK